MFLFVGVLGTILTPAAAQYPRVFMGQLRRKLEADPAHPKHLVTEPGVGYRLLTES
jgi:DNA-binding response OmpR family regulator